MGRQKAAVIVIVLLGQVTLLALLVVSLCASEWARQKTYVKEDVREINIGIFEFCDSLRKPNSKDRGGDTTRCVLCFNTAKSKTYTRLQHHSITQNFLPKSGHNSHKTGALLQTLAILTIIVAGAFFFSFLFYAQFALLLRMSKRLQNYLLLGTFLSGFLQIALTVSMLAIFRKHYRNVDMGTGQILIFIVLALTIIQQLLVIKIAHFIVKEYNKALLGDNGRMSMSSKRRSAAL